MLQCNTGMAVNTHHLVTNTAVVVVTGMLAQSAQLCTKRSFLSLNTISTPTFFMLSFFLLATVSSKSS